MSTPNGNLYKFMTFFGLLLFLTCVLLPYLKYDDNNKEVNQIRRNLVILSHEREALVNDIKVIEEAEDASADNSIVTATSNITSIKILEIKKGIDLRTEQISLENEIMNELLNKQNDIVYFMGYFVIFSFLITVFGFLLWYFKIQRPTNRSIKLEFLKQVSEQ